MKEIKLTRGYVTVVDDEDFEWLTKWRWHALISPTHVFPYAVSRGLRMHREIMRAQGVDIAGKEVDHINGRPLDNRRCNLRACLPRENHKNKRKRTRSTTTLKGVGWVERDKKFRARIMSDGMAIPLGYFHSELAAAHAYDKAAKIYHGEFAALNFPEAQCAS